MAETIQMPTDPGRTNSEAGYGVTLVTTDGQESTVVCDEQTTVLAAAERAGMILKSSCQAGGCGACSAVLSTGRVEMGDHDPDVIEVPEKDGGILLCRSFPRADCRIELPYAKPQNRHRPAEPSRSRDHRAGTRCRRRHERHPCAASRRGRLVVG